MQIKIVTTANMQQAEAQFAALRGQVEALNRAMAKTSLIPAGGSVQGFQQQTRAMRGANAAYNASLAASGKFRVEQLKLNDVLDKQVNLLQKQKLSFRQLWGSPESRKLMKSVYRDQLAMQKGFAAQAPVGGVTDGKLRTSLAIPTEVHKSWDTLNNRVGFFGHQLSSASTALQNWGKNTQWAGRQMMAGISMPIAAFGAAAGVMAYKVDKEMTRIQKVYDTTANANSKSARDQAAVTAEMERLKQDAFQTSISSAKNYGAAITDTLKVQAELAATGQRGAELQKNTAEIMRISMLGEIDHADTTKALIALQSTLGLTTTETTDAFNYMNAVENATSLSMKDFAVAIPKAAAPIKAMGGDVKDLGLLLVAMKERGIEAGEGANAIKAMMQRLYRPSKQIREEWTAMTGVDPFAIVREEGGDIMKILPRISKAVSGLNREERVQALAGLFGTYQVTRMNAMLEGIDQIGDRTKQTYSAIQVAGNEAAKNAAIAQREQDRYMNSAAGQFQAALRTLQAEIAMIGEDFLRVGSKFLQVVGWMAKGFNAMPKWAKSGAVMLAILVALVGPLVMLVGLFANFAGSLGKVLAALIKSRSGFELLTKAQIGERIEAELTRRTFDAQATSAQILTGQVNALTQAMAANAQAMAAANGVKLGPTNYAALAERGRDRASAIAAMGPTSQRASQIYSSTMGSKAGSAVFAGRTPPGMSPKEMERAYATNERISAEMAATQAKIAERTGQTKQNLTGGAVAGAAMAASMGTMMVSSNETANTLAQWVMMSAILIPSFKGMGAGMAGLKGKIADAVAKQKALNATSVATTAATGRTAGMVGKMGGGIRAAGAGFAAMMGPVGWITAGVAAVGLLTYKWFKYQQSITKELNAQSAAVTSQKNLANDTLKITERQLKTISTASAASAAGAPSGQIIAEQIRGTKSGKNLIELLRKDETSATEQAIIATEKYAQVLQASGGSAVKAQAYVEGMFLAAGDEAWEAQNKAQAAFNAIGTAVDPAEQSKLWGDLAQESMDTYGNTATLRGKAIGKQVADSIASGADASSTLKNFGAELNSKWDVIFDGVSSGYTDTLRNVGITSGAELKPLLQKFRSLTTSLMDPLPMLMKEFNIEEEEAIKLSRTLGSVSTQIAQEVNGINKVEQGTVQELARQLGLSEKRIKSIKTIADLEKTYNFQLLAANKENANALYKAEVARKKLAMGSEISDPIKRAKVNAEKLTYAQMAAASAGLEVVDNLSDQEMILMRAANAARSNANELDNAARKGKKFKDALSGIPKYIRVALTATFDNNAENMLAVKKAGMEGVTNDMADAASAGFEQRMNASLAGVQASWDKKIAGQQRAGENAQNKLENKWDRINTRFERRWDRRKDAVESYYDRRINGVEKTIAAEEKAEEIRQRIYEAEKTRISRLADMANQTIDFNLALRTGDLDEAAKIRNDMEATAQDWLLSDAAEGSKTKSEQRKDKLGAQKDRLEVERENAMKALEKREADEKASLERREKREKAALERRTKANADALAQQARDAQTAAQARWNSEKASFDQRLALFKSYIARDQKDLERWMRSVGLSYDSFGNSVKLKGESWSQYFERSMVMHMREAGQKMASDSMWAGLGAKNALEVARGMGFKNMNQFKKFITDGVMPATFGQNLNRAPKSKSGSGKKGNPTGATGNAMIAQHGGGWAGEKASNRRGVAKNYRGIHSSEVPLLAQKKEFIVNADSAKKFGSELESINRGVSPRSVRNTGDGVGGGGVMSGMAGLVMGAMGNALMTGVGESMKKAVAKKKAQIDAQSAYSAIFSAGGGGMFSDRSFNADQLNNAAIIANVGSSMGMSKRDIEIGIMTAITESGLVNIKGGDRDSAGLFQQRPSQGWGSLEQVTDPQYAARKFFTALRGHTERNDESPWLAAQHVQRSAFADGSNYRQYWDNAKAIFSKGLRRKGGGASAFEVANSFATGGSGGWHRPSIPGKGWSNSHDYRNGLRSPLFAYNDGRIIESRAIRSGGSGEGSGAYPRGYSSYGVTMVVQGKDGNKVRYAHLWPGTNAPVGPVKGGAKIGESAATGNASGPHTHFEVNGSEAAMQWFQKHGIGLRKGGHVRKDGMANIHKGEAVISPKRTKTLYDSLTTFGDIMNKVSRSAKVGLSSSFGGLNPGFAGITGTAASSGAAAVAAAGAEAAKGTSYSSGATSDGKAVARTGTFNAHTYGHSPAATINDLKKVLPNVDSLALQEWTGAAGNAQKWLLNQGFGLYRGPTGTAIAWRKSKYEASNFGSYDLNTKFRMPKRTSQRHAAYGLMRDKETGRKFWQASVHLIPGAKYFRGAVSEGHRNAILAEQYSRLSDLSGRLKQRAPVVIGGDMNDRAMNKIRGLDSSSRGKIIDQIYSNMKNLGNSVLSSKGLASDHAAVFTKYALPQMKNGGTVRFDNTLANLHKDERVLTAGLSSDLDRGIRNLASGGNTEYNLKVELNGANMDPDDVANVVMRKLRAHEARKPMVRR